jgi:hypothetical protein
MTENTDNIVYINNEEYDANDFNDRQKYLVAQIKVQQERVTKVQFELDRERAASDYFTSELIASIEASKNKEEKAS